MFVHVNNISDGTLATFQTTGISGSARWVPLLLLTLPTLTKMVGHCWTSLEMILRQLVR